MTIDTVPAGLRGVAVSDTAIGDVRGDEGYYHYRGRSAVELARTRTFDDAAALVLDGELPDEAGVTALMANLDNLPRAPTVVVVTHDPRLVDIITYTTRPMRLGESASRAALRRLAVSHTVSPSGIGSAHSLTPKT